MAKKSCAVGREKDSQSFLMLGNPLDAASGKGGCKIAIERPHRPRLRSLSLLIGNLKLPEFDMV